MRLSRKAGDTLLPGDDPIAGTIAQAQPSFRAHLARIYRTRRISSASMCRWTERLRGAAQASGRPPGMAFEWLGRRVSPFRGR